MTILDAPFDVFVAGPYPNGPGPRPVLPPGPPIAKLSVTIPVSREAIEDAAYIRAMFEAAMRGDRLRAMGFLGLVRCSRCRRATRCVEWMRVRGRDELLGSTCFRKRWAELVDVAEPNVEV